MGSSFYLLNPDELVLRVRVQPGAKQPRIERSNGELYVRLRAKPVEGAANTALIALLATMTGVPKSRITILRGDTARRKLLRVSTPAPEDALAKLERSLAPLNATDTDLRLNPRASVIPSVRGIRGQGARFPSPRSG